MGDSLEKLVKRLERNHDPDLYSKVKERIIKKIDQICGSYGFNDLLYLKFSLPSQESFKISPDSSMETLLDIEIPGSDIYKRLVSIGMDVAIYRGLTEPLLQYDGVSVQVYRYEDKFMFYNPLSRSIPQVWRKPSSLDYNKHHHTSTNHFSSKFFADIDIGDIENSVFYNGIGRIRTKNNMWLYAKFGKRIGTLSNQDDTSYVRLDVCRYFENKRYATYAHRYPVSYDEIKRDIGTLSDSLVTVKL